MRTQVWQLSGPFVGLIAGRPRPSPSPGGPHGGRCHETSRRPGAPAGPAHGNAIPWGRRGQNPGPVWGAGGAGARRLRGADPERDLPPARQPAAAGLGAGSARTRSLRWGNGAKRLASGPRPSAGRNPSLRRPSRGSLSVLRLSASPRPGTITGTPHALLKAPGLARRAPKASPPPPPPASSAQAPTRPALAGEERAARGRGVRALPPDRTEGREGQPARESGLLAKNTGLLHGPRGKAASASRWAGPPAGWDLRHKSGRRRREPALRQAPCGSPWCCWPCCCWPSSAKFTWGCSQAAPRTLSPRTSNGPPRPW